MEEVSDRKRSFNLREWRTKIKRGCETGRDATHIMLLTTRELETLRQKIKVDKVDKRGLGDEYEEFHCHITSPLNYKRNKVIGSVGVVVGVRNWDTTELSPFKSYQKGAVLLYEHGIFPELPEHEVSHLCGNAGCIRVDHLMWETNAENVKRINCRGLVSCGDHFCDTCVHEPKCKIMTKR